MAIWGGVNVSDLIQSDDRPMVNTLKAVWVYRLIRAQRLNANHDNIFYS